MNTHHEQLMLSIEKYLLLFVFFNSKYSYCPTKKTFSDYLSADKFSGFECPDLDLGNILENLGNKFLLQLCLRRKMQCTLFLLLPAVFHLLQDTVYILEVSELRYCLILDHSGQYYSTWQQKKTLFFVLK